MILIRCCVDGLCFPHSKEQVGAHNPHDEQMIEGAFPLRREGDLLIIVTALDRKRAGLGLWRVIGNTTAFSAVCRGISQCVLLP